MQDCCSEDVLALAFEELHGAVEDIRKMWISLEKTVAALERRQKLGGHIGYEPVGFWGTYPETRFGSRAVKWARLTRRLLSSNAETMHLLDSLLFDFGGVHTLTAAEGGNSR